MVISSYWLSKDPQLLTRSPEPFPSHYSDLWSYTIRSQHTALNLKRTMSHKDYNLKTEVASQISHW